MEGKLEENATRMELQPQPPALALGHPSKAAESVADVASAACKVFGKMFSL
jgi:hypothetical protein